MESNFQIFINLISKNSLFFNTYSYIVTADTFFQRDVQKSPIWLLWALNLATLPSMAGSRSGYGLTDTVAATAAVRADIPGTPGESDGFRLICCTCETESITGPELGQTPFGFCLPKPGNRPTGKNSVVWDSPSLGWWEETQLKNWLRLRRWGPPCEDHIEERERG